MIRLFGFLTMAAIAAGGFLFIDYRMSAQAAERQGGESPTISEYVSGLPDRIVGLTGASAASGRSASLADMLPKPPEGWTVRPVAAEDVDQFLPKSDRKADETAVTMIKDMALAQSDEGTEVAAVAYQNGDRTVLVRAVRYPDALFTDAAAIDRRGELQAKGPEFRGTEFMTVRGLDVTEDLLPEGFRGRYFLADVGAQIHLRVLAPKRMRDAELLSFFETLHVQAMNATVVDKGEGLGEAPVIVVASALEGDDRDAYLAEVKARQAAEVQRNDAARKAIEAEAAAKEAASSDQTASADQGSLIGGMLGSLFGTETPQVSPDELADHQAALIEAAQSGDTAAAAAHADAVYGAIAKELETTGMKGASGFGSASSGSNSAVEVGIGNCVTEGGKKVCSVGGSN